MLKELTDISDSEKNTFTVFNSDAIHINIYSKDFSKEHYSMEKFAFEAIGDYLNYLKENVVYDNTRIIIVSDHGEYNVPNNSIAQKYTRFNPLLFVKDFNAKGEYTVNNEFMTNADTSIMAVKDVIQNPVNPFSKKDIRNFVNKKKIGIYESEAFFPVGIGASECIKSDFNYIEVKQDIFKDENWSGIKEKKK